MKALLPRPLGKPSQSRPRWENDRIPAKEEKVHSFPFRTMPHVGEGLAVCILVLRLVVVAHLFASKTFQTDFHNEFCPKLKADYKIDL